MGLVEGIPSLPTLCLSLGLWDGVGWLSQALGCPWLALELAQGFHPCCWVQPCVHTAMQRGQAVLCAAVKPTQESAGELTSNLQDSGGFFLLCLVQVWLFWVFFTGWGISSWAQPRDGVCVSPSLSPAAVWGAQGAHRAPWVGAQPRPAGSGLL